ncbi:radical SAM protein [Candidatus Bathyarchaeota archaeon]|nr:radical SAM protein [Candidatus Bathyarchaeota archaeon]
MSDGFPEALQIEVTNKCNFNCQMCIRHVWNTKLLDMDITLYRKIAETCFPKLRRLVLYGFGEPFAHPQILEMLRVARKNLPENGEVIISTNGSLITPKIAVKIVKGIGVDSISFSIDAVNQAKLSCIREGSDFRLIAENLRGLAKNKDKAKRDFKLGLEIVIMKDNFLDIPDLVRFAVTNNVDYIIASHVVPYTKEIFAKTMYLTLSKPAIEILKPSLRYGWSLIRESALEVFGKAYGVEMETALTQLIKSFWVKARRKGYWINLPVFLSSTEKLGAVSQLEEIFHESKKIAHEYQIDLKLPNLYPDAKKRACPYMEKETLVVRSDGKVSPCQEFMYTHPFYVNAHKKEICEVIFGDLAQEGVEEVWRRNAYANFREIRRDMANNMPWCGDCPYSALGCFYTRTNDVDCYSNAPACSECLYSVNLVQCII